MSVSKYVMLAAIVLLVGCGGALEFLGSVSQTSGSSQVCTDYSVEGSNDQAKISQAKAALAGISGYSADRCDASGAIGTCELTQSGSGVSIKAVAYYKSGNRATARTSCESSGGTWSDR